MKSFDFSLRFRLPKGLSDPDEIVDRLGGSGCTDALVGLGLPGYVGLDFTREARTAANAMQTAIADVHRALPGTTLVEAAPDYVGLSEVAEVVGQSRQNIRKLMMRHHDRFPAPIHTGNPSLWHLAQVLDFLADRNVGVPPAVADVARTAMRINASRPINTSG
jgi:predicted DNA-binding transcriptional regulator AlpA